MASIYREWEHEDKSYESSHTLPLFRVPLQDGTAVEASPLPFWSPSLRTLTRYRTEDHHRMEARPEGHDQLRSPYWIWPMYIDNGFKNGAIQLSPSNYICKENKNRIVRLRAWNWLTEAPTWLTCQLTNKVTANKRIFWQGKRFFF